MPEATASRPPAIPVSIPFFRQIVKMQSEFFYARTWSAPSRSKDFSRCVHLPAKGEPRYRSNEIYFFILISIWLPSFSQSVSNLNKSIRIWRVALFVPTVRGFYYVVVAIRIHKCPSQLHFSFAERNKNIYIFRESYFLLYYFL